MIDVHTHLHPPRLFAAIRRWFAERSSWQLDHPTEPAAVAAALRGQGVERFVFCSYAHRPGMAHEINTWLGQTSRELGGFGLPLATVHLDDPDYLAVLHTALADGCIGLKIHEDVQRFAVDDPRLDSVYNALTASSGFVLAHIGPIPWSRDTREGPARVAAVLTRHPHLRFVVAHMGVPDTLAYFKLTTRFTNLFIDTTMAFTSDDLRTDVSSAQIAAVRGSIVYGSDYPNIPYAYATDIAAISALGLGAATERAIFKENARRLSPFLADTGSSGLPPASSDVSAESTTMDSA